MPENYLPITVICLGDRLDKDGKLTQYWSEVKDGTIQDAVACWTKSLKGAAPGAIYKFHTDGGVLNATRSMGGDTAPHYERMYHMQDELTKLQTQHKAAHLSKDAISREKREKSKDALKERLAPITAAYAKSGTRERAAIITLVIRYIMGVGF